MEERLKKLFKKKFGEEVISCAALPAHASKRTFRRLSSSKRSVIGVSNSNKAENKAFVAFAKHFLGYGLPVPEVYTEDLKNDIYLIEDLGDTTLFDIVAKHRSESETFPDSLEKLYHRVAEILPRFQTEAGDTIDFSFCYEGDEFDGAAMIHDMEYFRDEFLNRAGVGYEVRSLEKDFESFKSFLLGAERQHFLYRDFQARNIMVRGDDLYFIDFQSGRKGAVHYDLASLLYQSQARIPEDARQRIIQSYLRALEKFVPVQRDTFMSYFYAFVCLRFLQVLGAYGKLGLGEGKQYFIDGIPLAVGGLNDLIDNHPFPMKLPELERVIRALRSQRSDAKNKLTVTLQSFSYKDGLPAAVGDNGGGFVFDCRCVPNPGRETRFTELTGRDEEVKAYLSQQPSASRFFLSIKEIAFQAIENYLARGFSELQISFGCTGGQHRSVFFTEELAREIKNKFTIGVNVEHRDVSKMRGRRK